MKKIAYYFALLGIIVSLSACATHVHKRGNGGLPPGKAKKIFGTKSAKPFAPGQQKKKQRKGNNGRGHHHDVLYFDYFGQ